MRRASLRAAVIFAVLSWSSSSIILKLDFFIQPTADVLSPIDNRQESGGMLSSRTSIHMQIMDAMNSSRLMWARDRRCFGNCSRHALPDAEYPPRPCSHASDLKTCVGKRYVRRFMLIPLCADFKKSNHSWRSVMTCFGIDVILRKREDVFRARILLRK